MPVRHHNHPSFGPLQQGRELIRIEQRRVAGHEQRPLEARGLGVVDARERGGRLARLLIVGQHQRPRALRYRLGGGVGGYNDEPIELRDVAQRAEHVGEHGLRERLA